MSRPTGNTAWPDRARGLAPRQRADVGEHETRADRPIPVTAWLVTVAGADMQVDAEAIAWTRRAVEVRYVDRHGRPDSAWVWAGAVTRRAPASEPQPPRRM